MKTITEMLADVEKINKPRRPFMPILFAIILAAILLGAAHV